MKILKAFLADTRAATSIEYAMIAAGISIMIVAAARSIGSNITSLYINSVSGNLT
ncbi:MAG: Flp family type IVb pilin [Beijerinckiaceae bacterium]|nr:Flp family type IVb pilin [Beijerinckiaceae bacterium]